MSVAAGCHYQIALGRGLSPQRGLDALPVECMHLKQLYKVMSDSNLKAACLSTTVLRWICEFS